MPVMNGYEATKLIREAERTYNLIFSASDDRDVRVLDYCTNRTRSTAATDGGAS